MAAGNLGQGALVFLNTSPVLKQQKGATRLTAKYSNWETRQQTDRVWTVAALLCSPSSSSRTVQSGRGGRAREAEEPTDEAFWPEMFKAKAHTHRNHSGPKEQQLWGFQAQQEHECVGFSLHTELTFYIHKSFILIFEQAREQDKGNAMRQLTSTVHRRIIYRFYVEWTAKLCRDRESEKKFMAKKVKLHLRARWATCLELPLLSL